MQNIDIIKGYKVKINFTEHQWGLFDEHPKSKEVCKLLNESFEKFINIENIKEHEIIRSMLDIIFYHDFYFGVFDISEEPKNLVKVALKYIQDNKK